MLSPADFIGHLESVSLENARQVNLSTRQDSKYLVSKAFFADWVHSIGLEYRVVHIDDEYSLPYLTRYFDTSDFAMYYDHIRGKGNRYKLRFRHYYATNQTFIESKFKNNKGVMYKHRMPRKCMNLSFSSAEDEFIRLNSTFERKMLHSVLWNSFKRITLVHESFEERMTIDFNLQFSLDKLHWHRLGEVVIIEVKKGVVANLNSTEQSLRLQGICPVGFSKYCTGMALIHPLVRTNLMNERLRIINKIA